MVDQVLSSLSNFLLTVVVAKYSDVATFGAFGLAFATYHVALGSSRAAVSEPALIRGTWRRQPGVLADERAWLTSVLSSASLVGAACAVAFALVAVVTKGPVSGMFGAFAVWMIALILVDAVRYSCFSLAKAKLATAVDATWLLLQVLLTGTLLHLGKLDGELLLSAWGAGACLAAIFGLARLGTVPMPWRGVEWLAKNRDLSPRFVGEYLTIAGVQQGLVYISAGVGGLAASASIRAAQTLLGPVNVITQGSSVIVLPVLARKAREALASLPRYSILVGTALATAPLLMTVVVLLVPHNIGVAILGANWAIGVDFAPWFGLALAFSGMTYGATAGLRAMERVQVSLRIRVIAAPLVLALIAVGASTAGARGALLAYVIGVALQSAAWWSVYLLVWRRAQRGLDAYAPRPTVLS